MSAPLLGGVGVGRFMESPLSLCACIGTMNLSNAVGARLGEPQRVATAPSPAGHRPALRDGRFMESPLSLCACIGTMNRFVLVLVVLVLESKPPNRGRGRERRRGRKGGSWRASTASWLRIEAMSLPRAVAWRDSVVECGSPLPLFPACVGGESARGLAQSKTWRPCSGSWRALFRLFSACIGTMNRFVLVLVVLVLESKPPNRGRGRERRRGRKGGSWKALFRLFSACIGT